MSTLFVDADACPVTREAITIARAHGMSVVLVANTNQSFARYEGRSGVETVTVGTGRDSADFAIIERLGAEDVVVTQDIGLAAMVLGRGAGAISPRGRIFYQRDHRHRDGGPPRRAEAPPRRRAHRRTVEVHRRGPRALLGLSSSV